VERIASVLTPDARVIVLAGVKRQLGDSIEVLDQNMNVTLNIARVLEKRAVRKVVYLSSAAVYGEDIHNTHITEQTPVHARTFYGIGKYASERVLWKTLAGVRSTSLLVLRPPLVYGRGDESEGYGPAGFARKFARKEELVVWGDGAERREFLFVDDLARAVVELLDSDCAGVVNPVSGSSHSFQDVLDALARIHGRVPAVARRERTKDKVDNIFDGRLFASILPSFCFTPLEEGLRSLVIASESEANR
jgi:UDP-glucose 4-epimerase